MQQSSQAEKSGGNYGGNIQNTRNTTYEGNRIGDNARAHFGDQYQQNHGLTINANNVDLSDRVLQQLAKVDPVSSYTQKTFGLCLGQAPQIEQDAFLGRTAELKQLREWLQQDNKTQKVVSIVGMGGLGKTQLSLAYAREETSHYTSIFWCNAKDELSLQQSMSALASIVSVDTPTDATVATEKGKQVERIQRWLSEEWNCQWLLIFDNYDDPNLPNIHSETGFDIRSYFPYRAQGSILITTRSPKLTFNADARQLAIRLDGLPLALATAGVYLGQTSITCTEYLQLYESAWADLYGPDSEELLEYDRTLSSTWKISLEQVSRLDNDAAELFKFLAYFNNKDIWYELIKTGENNELAWLERVTASKLRFDRAMMRLQDYSLVQNSFGSYTIHPCIHDWISEHFEKNGMAFIAALDCVADNLPHQSDPSYLSVSRRLLLHADRINDVRFRTLWEASSMNEKCLEASIILGMIFKDWEQLTAAEDMYNRALVAYLVLLESDLTLDIGTLHNCMVVISNLGCVYAEKKNLEEAEIVLKEALRLNEEIYGYSDSSTLHSVNDLASLYHSQGKLTEAEEMYKQALSGYESISEDDDENILIICNNLSHVYTDLGKLKEAEEILLRVREGQEQDPGGDVLLTLRIYDNLGWVYERQCKYEVAERWFLKALEGKERIPGGEDHVSTLHTLRSVAVVCARQGKLDQAETHWLRALAGYRSRPGLDDASIEEILKNLRLLGEHRETGVELKFSYQAYTTS